MKFMKKGSKEDNYLPCFFERKNSVPVEYGKVKFTILVGRRRNYDS